MKQPMRGIRYLLFLIMIGLGLMVGLLYGWVINPVQYKDTSPSTLHPDYKADYVLMVAQIYHMDKNLVQAARRLTVLDSLSPARIVAEGVQTAQEREYAPVDIEKMQQLQQALTNQPPAPAATRSAP